MPNKKETKFKRMLPIYLTIMFAIIILFLASGKEQQPVQTIAGGWDISSAVKAYNYEEFLVETPDFDYSHPLLQAKASEIKESTSNPKDSIKETIRFVANHVRYSGSVSVNYCYQETASSVYEIGTGDCVSMSRLVTALLRAQGIPTKTVGGCLSASRRCIPLMTVIPGLEAKTMPMLEGDFKKRGFLHEWVEVWTPDEGWMLVEATSGQVFELECAGYLFYSYDSNQYNRCVITDASFWDECKTY